MMSYCHVMSCTVSPETETEFFCLQVTNLFDVITNPKAGHEVFYILLMCPFQVPYWR